MVLDSPFTACNGINVAASSNNADVAVSPSNRSFSSAVGSPTQHWNRPQTFTVTAAQDGDSIHDTATITHSILLNCDADGYTTTLALPSLTVTVNDDDVPTVALALAPMAITENGGVSTVTATLNRTSGAATEVTVAAAPGAGTDFTQTGTRLTIAAGQTTSTGTVTLTAADNAADAPDKTVTVSATAAGGRGVANPANVTLTLTDDDTAGITADPTSGLRTTEAGGTAAFRVTLDSEPTGAVVLDVASSDTTEGTVMPSALTFAAADWNTDQTVTLTGQDDSPTPMNPNPSAGTRPYTVTLTVNTTATQDATYDALSAVTVNAQNADDEYGLAPGTVTGQATEAGGTAAFTVKLNTQPGATVIVTVASQDTSEGLVSAGSGVPAASTSLTFTSGTWDTEQTVTVTGQNDDVDDGTVTWTVRLTAASSDTNYNTLTEDVSVTTTDDDDAPTVTLAAAPAAIAENGGVATVTATLSHASGADTTVTVTAGTGYTVGTDAVIVIPAEATAAPTDVAMVQAADDVVHQGSAGRDVTVTATVANARATADSTTMAVTGAALRLTDDEALPTVALALSSASVTEEGGVSTVTATLSGASSAAVTVTVNAAAGTGAVGADFGLSTARTLTIAAGDTASTGTVTVTANGNAVDSPDKSVTVSGTVTGGHGVAVPAAVTLTLTDNEALPTVALGLAPTSITESGGISTVTATLSGASSEAVVVTVGAAAGTGAVAADFDLSTATTLTIPAGQMTSTGLVTVTANGNDVDAADKSVTVSGTVTGGNGVAAPANVTLTLTDDDVRSVTLGGISMNALVVPEQGSATYTVALATEPTGAVTIQPGFATGGDADLTLNPAAPVLTFDATTWQTGQTVTVEAADDADAAAGTATLTHTVSGADYNGLTVAGVTVTESDNETPTLSIAGATVTEGAAGASTALTFTVTLSPASSGQVTVEYADAGTGTATSGTDYVALAAGTLTFAAGTTTHTITVTVRGDAVDEADETIAVTLSHALPSPGSAIGTGTATGTITDDDERGVTVSAAVSGLGVTEESTAAYTVRLTSQPTGRVTVAVGGTTSTVTVDVAAAAGNQTAVTFTASTWATARTVTVTAGEDGNSQSETVTLTHAVSGADYGANTVPAADVTVTVTDNDTPGLAVSPTTLAVTEEQRATYTVRLHTQPSANVAVAVASGATAVATVAPSTVTFTATDWATAQPVTVTGTADADATTNEQATVTHTPSGASEYTGLAPAQRPSVTVTVTDDERQGVTVSAAGSGLPVTEGATATYTVVLTAAPVGGAVTVTVSGTTSTVTADVAAAAGNQTALTFTATDWATAQPVTVTAGEDENSGGETVTLTHGVAGADYGGVTVGSVTVRVTDNDTPALVIDANPSTPGVDAGPLALKELSTDPAYRQVYTVKLATQPSGSVHVRVQPPDAVTVDVAAAAGNQETLTFSPVTWALAQPVTVTAAQDDDAGDETAALTHAGSGHEYGLVTQTLTVTVDDDETPGVTLSVAGSDLTVTENGQVTYTVRLDTEPVRGAVTIRPRLLSGGDPHLSLAPAVPVLTFTASTWRTAQAVTVRAADDPDPDAGTATLSHTVSGADYGGVTVPDVTVTEADDDAPGIRITPTELAVEEGTTGTYTVELHTLPTGAVTVTVTHTGGSPDVAVDADATPTTRTLVFTTGNWHVAQPVTVTAKDDDDGTDEEPTTLTHAVSSSDADYQSLPNVTVTVRVTDDDEPGVTVSAAGSNLTVAEGSTATYTVVLATLPTEAVTVTITRTAERNPDAVRVGPDTTPATRTLVFTTGAWHVAQTVTVSAAEDAEDYRDERATLTHAVSSGDTDYNTLPAAQRPAVTVIVADDSPVPEIRPNEGETKTQTINGYEVSFTREVGTPEAVVNQPRDTDGAFEVEIKQVEVESRPEVIPEGSRLRFSLDRSSIREDGTGVDITVTSEGKDISDFSLAERERVLGSAGLTVCLPVSEALWQEARESGRKLYLLHQQNPTDGPWTIVAEATPPPVYPEGYRLCASGLTDFSPFVVAIDRGEDLKFAKDDPRRMKEFLTGTEVRDGKGELPKAKGGDEPITYALLGKERLRQVGLDYLEPAAGADHGGTITGTPTTPMEQQEFTLTVRDRDGDTDEIPVTIKVKPGIQSRDLGLVLAGVGRTLATDAVEILGNRFGAPASRLQVTLGGQVLRLTAPASSAPPSPSAPPPSPLEGEGRGEGSLLQGAGAPLPDEAPVGSRLTRPAAVQGSATPAPAAGPSPWQQATGVALGVARALGITLEFPTAGNSPAASSPSPLAGEGRGEGASGEGSLLQGQGNIPGRGPADLRRGTSTANLLRIQPVSAKDLLARSAFELPLTRTGEDGVPAWTLWGRGSASGFSGQPEEGFTMAGTLTSGYVGVDYRPRSAMLLGLAVAHSTGEVTYERTEATKAGLDVEMTSLLPYAHWQVRPGLGVWGLAGLGWGQMALKLDGDPQTYTTGLTSWLGAVGGRQALTTWQGIDLAAKTDAFVTTVRSAGQTNLDAARGQAQRVRLVLEGQTAVAVSPVARVEPRLELGGRWDSGTAEQGLGAELGGGVTYVRTDWGLSVAGQGRYLLVHEDGAFEDWGASVAVRVDPGLAGQGLTLTVAPVWGQAASGVEQVWGTAPGVPGGRDAAPAGWRPGRVELDVGYGVALAQGVVTPYSGVSLGAPGAARYRLGSHWTGAGLDVTVEGDRTEQPGQAPAHRVSVRLGWQW